MNSKKTWVVIFSVIALLGILLLAACSKKESTETSNAPEQKAAPAATPIDPNTVATINGTVKFDGTAPRRSEEHTSELQSQFHLVCRLLLEKKKKQKKIYPDSPCAR